MSGERREPLSGQAVVRVGRLEAVMRQFQEELVTKTGILLNAYDARYVEPLRKRVAWLELSPLGKARAYAVAWVAYLKMRRGKAPEPPDETPPA